MRTPVVHGAAIALVLFAAAPPLAAHDKPSVIMQAPGITVQAGARVAIYAFAPSAPDPRPTTPWPYPYPAYPGFHPAFPAVPMYPAYSAPAPYVPLGSPYPPPPVEIRSMELKPGGRLVIEVEPRDAEVFVDGLKLTTRGPHGFEIGVLAGRHRLDVRRAGRRPWSQDVDVPPGGGLLVTVELMEEEKR
jgi:hypothetical protein